MMIIKKIGLGSNNICDYVMVSTESQSLTRNSALVAWENNCSSKNPGIVVNFENTTSNRDPKKRLSVESPSLLSLDSKTLLVNRLDLVTNISSLIAEIPFEQNISNDTLGECYYSFIDYGAKHGGEYRYYFSVVDTDGTRSNEISLPQVISPSWDHWTLLLGDNYVNQNGKEDKNKVIIDKIFLFELNTTSGQMQLGTKFFQQENFTPYPKIQKNYAHNWSGTLNGLLGMIAPNGVDFIQTPQMLQEWKNLAQNGQRKFLKDRDGNLWEVELTNAPGISNTDNLTFDLKTKSLSWTEVADATNTALYAFKNIDEWIQTETGYSNPLNTYTISETNSIISNWRLTDN